MIAALVNLRSHCNRPVSGLRLPGKLAPTVPAIEAELEMDAAFVNGGSVFFIL